MTALMRNGRDRRSENPKWATRGKNASFCLGPISGSHQGQRPLRLHRDRDNPPSANRPDTWLHPNDSLKRQIPLAPRAVAVGTEISLRPPHIYGPAACCKRNLRMGMRSASIYPASGWSLRSGPSWKSARGGPIAVQRPHGPSVLSASPRAGPTGAPSFQSSVQSSWRDEVIGVGPVTVGR